MRKNYNVVVPVGNGARITEREFSAAEILAGYFKKHVYVQPCTNHKTADFRIGGVLWELKTPTGTGKYNIQHAIHAAVSQSENIIIDARFSKFILIRLRASCREN